ncbi:MAG: amidohydrolase family protein [Planctomycetes bacterium]|nr:amidohydrolase family protein [Planctomycetota bacterium]
MIVDCYTHTWETPEQLGRCLPPDGGTSAGASQCLDPRLTGVNRHLASAKPADATFVLGFKSQYLDAEIPNERVASYVSQHPECLIGFAGVDPSRPSEAIAELRRAHDELGMKGVAVAPAAQDFHPSNSQAMLVYAEAADLQLPVLFHTGVCLSSAIKLEYARPVLLDEVARELPGLKMIIAHLGCPWVDETLLLLAKHENVYAEISWLPDQPWHAYQALLGANQLGVTDKLLFGSGFPQTTVSHCIEELYELAHLVQGTTLPNIPRERLRGIVERDALSLLGITMPVSRAAIPATSSPGGDY